LDKGAREKRFAGAQIALQINHQAWLKCGFVTTQLCTGFGKGLSGGFIR
jgi:hypothetical protein